MNARIYARFSPRRDEEKCESIEKQVDKCRAYCEANDLEVVGVYEDRAAHGYDEGREGLNACLNDLEPGETMVSWESSRVARDAILMLQVCSKITDKGASLHTLDGMRLDASLDAWFMASIKSVVDEYERRRSAKRTKEAMLHLQKSGQKVGGTPIYGWKFEGDRLVHSSPEIGHVRGINDMWKRGIAQTVIVRQYSSLPDAPSRSTIQRMIKRFETGDHPPLY